MATTATPDSNFGQYKCDHYFAFVESSEPITPLIKDMYFEAPEEWQPVIAMREKMALDLPSEVIWLDCVRASYFDGLDWKDETCTIDNADESVRRRKRLRELDLREFAVALLLLDRRSDDEREELGRFSEMSWHLVRLASHGGFPVFSGPDFDLEPGSRRIMFVRHERFTNETELTSLRNIFSLDFLPNIDLDGRERPDGSTPPRNRPPHPKSHTEPYVPPLLHQTLRRRQRHLNWKES